MYKYIYACSSAQPPIMITSLTSLANRTFITSERTFVVLNLLNATVSQDAKLNPARAPLRVGHSRVAGEPYRTPRSRPVPHLRRHRRRGTHQGSMAPAALYPDPQGAGVSGTGDPTRPSAGHVQMRAVCSYRM
jgi:hypothetical protein